MPDISISTEGIDKLLKGLRVGQRRGLVDRKLVKAPPPPSNFIAGRSKAALLVWFFGGVACGYVLLFLLEIKIENR